MTLNNKLLFKTGCLLKRFLQQSPHFLPILFISVGAVLFFLHVLLPHYPALFCPPPAHSPLGFSLSVPRPPVERVFHPHEPTPDLLLCGHSRQPIRVSVAAPPPSEKERRTRCIVNGRLADSSAQGNRLGWEEPERLLVIPPKHAECGKLRDGRRDAAGELQGKTLLKHDIKGKVEHRGGL